MGRTELVEPTEQAADRTTADDGATVLLVEESLVEEVSIDGMCGVY